MMSKLWLVAACLLIAGCGGAQHYEIVGRRGNYTYLVYVPKEYSGDQAVYERAIRAICADPERIYILMFWEDRGQVWRRDQPEMTLQQSKARVAGYTRNPETGLNEFYWLRDGEREDVGPVE